MNDHQTLLFQHRPRCLTSRKMAVLARIYKFTQEHGYTPTIREITEGLRMKSHSSVHAHLVGLERDGFVSKQERSIRAWTLTGKAYQVLNVSRLKVA